MNHDEYWKKVMSQSEKNLCRLFEGCRTQVSDIVGGVAVAGVTAK